VLGRAHSCFHAGATTARAPAQSAALHGKRRFRAGSRFSGKAVAAPRVRNGCRGWQATGWLGVSRLEHPRTRRGSR
jgi:hypothetical protein